MDNKGITYNDIPPEDKTLCNNAEGCDNCKWNVVCFVEDELPEVIQPEEMPVWFEKLGRGE